MELSPFSVVGRPCYIRGQEVTTMKLQLTAVFEQVPNGYIGYVEELPGANTQADTLEEARENLAEAVELVLEANRALAEERLIDRDVIREPLRITA
jgi:predicted RNase H-like HicB family nuclease